MPEVTELIEAIYQGRDQAADGLLPLVYDELRQLAKTRLAKEKPGQTLQATALVHEAYIRLVGKNNSVRWNGRAHFFGAAAEAMRRILIEQARRKGRTKRGGDWQREVFEIVSPAVPGLSIDLIDLSDALESLARVEPIKATLVKLRYFAGFTLEEAADMLDISSATADRYWKYSRAWLADRLQVKEMAGEISRAN